MQNAVNPWVALARIRGLWAALLCVSSFGWATWPASAQPANDNFEDAQLITGAGGSVAGSNVGATEQIPDEPIHYSIGGVSVWFRWVAPKDGPVYFHTMGSSFDTMLAAYTGTTLTGLVQIAANDDVYFFYLEYGLASYISFEAQAGVEYFIALDGFFGATGDYMLSWSQPGEAGIFNFTSPAYMVTEEEGYGYTGWDNDRDLPGAMITVNRLGGSQGRVLVDFYVTNTMITNYYLTNWVSTNNSGVVVTNRETITNVIASAEPYEDYYPTNGTLLFDHLQTSTNFVMPVGYGGIFMGNRTNRAVFALVYLTNPRPALEENPDLVAPVIGLTNIARVDILQIYDYRANFSLDRAFYRVDEKDPVVWVTIVLPGAGGGSVILETIDRANGYISTPFYFALHDGSDYADDRDAVFPNPPYTDGSPPITNRADFVTYSQRITFGNDIVAHTVALRIPRDDSVVEFNEDIMVRLRDPQGNKGIFHGTANITILYDDQPAGALDREWNPDNVSFTVPPFNLKPGANNEVFAVGVQGDQKTIIGGDFTAYNTVPRSRVARLNQNGSLDTTFNPGTGADGFVSAVLPYPAVFSNNLGRVLVGGAFSSINNLQRNGIARLNANGSLDTTFTPGTGFDGVVRGLSFMSDGKIVAVGDFNFYNGIERRGVARLNNDGSLDRTFDPGMGANGIVWSVGVDNQFQTLTVSANMTGPMPAEFRTNLNTRANSGVISVQFAPACVPDRLTIYYGAQQIFDSRLTNEYRNDLNCSPINLTGPISYFLAFGPGGATDITLVVNEGGGDTNETWSVEAQIETFFPGERVYLGGEFTAIDGIPRNGVARLNQDGDLDATFDPGDGVNGPVFALAVQGDGKMLLGGRFDTVDFRDRRCLARLNADGSLDLTYDPGDGADNSVFSIIVQPDGKAVIGGQFITYDTVRRMGLARVFTNGILDTSFMDTAYNHFAGLCNPFSFNPPNFVNAIAMQPDGNFMIGGSFTTVGGNASSEINNNAFHTPVWTRQDRRTRYNVARILGGYTPGPGNAALAYSEYTADENGNSLAIKLQRFDGRLGTLQATMQTTNRVAEEGIDYLAITNTPTWLEFNYVAPRSVGDVGPSYAYLPLLDDQTIEGDEGLDALIFRPSGSLMLGGGYQYYYYGYYYYYDYYYYGYYGRGEYIPLGGARGRFQAPVTIVDNDFNYGVLAFSQPIYSMTENGLEATITVIRTNGAVGAVAVDYATLNGTAIAGQDYQARQGTLVFASGQTSRNFTVSILNDLSVEPDETVLLVLTNASGGAKLPGGLPTSSEKASLSIIDDDFAPGHLNFAMADFPVSETAGRAEITVTRTGGSVGQVSVRVATSPGTALDGLDYVGTNTVLSWANGDITPRIVPIPIINEVPPLIEGPERFSIVLSNPSIPGAIGQTGSATVTIEDDDAFGSLAFAQPMYEADENGGTTAVTIIRFGGTAGTVRVDYLISDGPPGMGNAAVEGEDFMPAAGTLVFGPGETAKRFSITLLDDNEKDGDKLVSLFLQNPVNGSLVAPTNAYLTIVDNESFNIPAGSLDTTFDASAGPNGDVFALALQPDGKVVVAGEFGRLNNITKTRIGRVNANGTIDGLFSIGPGPNASVRALALQPDGKVLLGGFFTTVHGTNRNRIARLNKDGAVDTSFNPGSGADSPVFAMELLENGKVLMGGAFANYNGIIRPGVALLQANGSLDLAFDPGLGADEAVLAVAHQRDGKILIAGEFTTVGTTTRNRVARLNPNGSVDLTFDPGPGPNGNVQTVVVQPDGRILIGGSFDQVDGVPRSGLARLLPDGDLDTDFLAGSSGANNLVMDIALQLDGKILVAGDFTQFNGVTRNRITRLFPDGRTDPTINFGAGANAFISSLIVQPDRRILIGGGFTEFNLLLRNRLARLHGGSIVGPGSVEFSFPFLSVNESVGEARIILRRVGGTTGDVSVNFQDLPGSATPGEDYLPTNGVLSFLEGEVQQSFKVVILNDSLAEPEETVLFLLATNGSDGLTLGPQPVTALNIVSDDSVVGFKSSAYKVSENVPSGFAVIDVERTGAINSTVSVNYATVNGTALNNQDYVSTNGTLIFTNGQSLQSFRVGILDNTFAEPNETVGLVLSSLTGSAVFGLRNATLTILDDDFGPGELSFSANEYFVSESSSNALLTVVRTNGAVGTLSMTYFTSGGSATPDEDFASVRGFLDFGDGQTERSFTIPIVGDTITEGNETFFVTVSNLLGGAIFSGPATVRVTILDDEFPLGTLDQCFDPGAGANALVRTLGLQSDGKIVVGGAFTRFDNAVRNFITRLNVDGSQDLTFDAGAGANGLVSAVAVQSDDKVMVGGAFTVFDGIGFQRVARLGINGQPDLNYNQVALFNASVNALAVQQDNRLVVGGSFSLPTRSITQLRLNGSIDTSFNPGPGVSGPVHAVVTLPDGSVIIGGAFTNVAGVRRDRMARFTAEGALDTGFQPPAITNGSVFCLALQPDGQVLLGGDFRLAAATNGLGLARLHGDGSLDQSFQPGTGANAAVFALGLQSDGRMIVGGSFTRINDVPRNRYARLNLDGSLDEGFEIGSGANNTVYTLLVTPDDNIIIGGDFTAVNGVPRSRVAKVLGAQQKVFKLLPLVLQDGQARITVTTQPGKDYVLEASADLIQWTPITTNNAVCTILELIDANANTVAKRFYRVRTDAL